MTDKMTRYGTAGTAFVIVLALLLFSWLTVEVEFPVFEYRSDLDWKLVPVEPYNDLGASVSRFLWDHRALDLTAQAFVLVAAVTCCLALLKPDVEGS
jgi:hypothetical protein